MARWLNLLPGWGFRASVWQALVPFLGADWQANPVELPWGEPSLRWTAADGPLAQQLRPGWSLGWSLGGTLALALGDRPGIEGVVLLAATPYWLREPGWPAGLEAQQLSELRGQLEDEPASALRHFAALVALGASQPSRVRSALQHHQLGSERAGELIRSLDLLRSLDLRLPPGGVRIVAIAGGGDRLLTEPAPPHWLRSLGAGPCSVLPETGHAPLLSDPSAVAGALRRLTADHHLPS